MKNVVSDSFFSAEMGSQHFLSQYSEMDCLGSPIRNLSIFGITVWAAGFSLTPYLEYFTPILGLGTPVFQAISSILPCRTPTFSPKCLWDSYFQNPSENPGQKTQVLY